jgi:hypothetical protein
MFDLMRLPSIDRLQVAHYLDRCERLNPSSGVYQLFWPTRVDARCIRVSTNTREYTGYYHSNQGQYDRDYYFIHMTGLNITPKIDEKVHRDGTVISTDEANMKTAISAINKLRPK